MTTSPQESAAADESILVSLAGTAALLGGIGRSTVYQLIDAGELDRVRIGSRAFVSRASIEAYVGRLAEAQRSQDAGGAR